MLADGLSGGFHDAPVEASLAFRAVMKAMARPGTIERVCGAAPPAPLSVAAGAVVLSLCDPETPLHLAGVHDCEALRKWITFHTAAPLVARSKAMFALGFWHALMPVEGYPIGTADYPDRSATLIVEMDSLEARGAQLRGPGIETRAALSLPEKAVFRANAARFPLGLDFMFTCQDRLAALPRSTQVEDL